MWITRTVDTCRCWFIVDINGILRNGLVAADFTASLIDETDSAITHPTVVESTQKPGLYYIDIPSSFLVAHGTGHYGVVVEIDTVSGPSGPPEVVATLSAGIKVFAEDFDSLVGQGLTPTQSTMLLEIYRLYGLDPTRPLLVTSSARTAGAGITQTVVESPPGTVTVTRQ